ncbi:MAG: hypothetical protein ACD_3C00120G0006 [uncultured bacterium (gcode 4)]|uniref:Uncharacterized protein n=1 Tax=uncultured bacterium (gcode 4) TaxID=1234023 RepID=K2GCI4_9BACT|nr:MAG: hypothetical protein ACD_3C00120G0006 [uncultured bacterium (gcode 4)]
MLLSSHQETNVSEEFIALVTRERGMIQKMAICIEPYYPKDEHDVRVIWKEKFWLEISPADAVIIIGKYRSKMIIDILSHLDRQNTHESAAQLNNETDMVQELIAWIEFYCPKDEQDVRNIWKEKFWLDISQADAIVIINGYRGKMISKMWI